jgi:hypothetical protein
MINSKKAHSKIIITVLLVCIVLISLVLVINFYFIFGNVPKNVSSDIIFNVSSSINFTHVDFISKSIICGNESSKHIRTFIRETFGNESLIGIKFIVKDKNGKNYSYIVDNSSILPNFQIREKRIDLVYSKLGINSSENITGLQAIPIFNGFDGKQIFGEVFLSPEVCYSSCNDCSVSCELICTNSTG